MAKVKVTQIRSVIGHPKSQKVTLKTLGIRKLNHSVEVELNPRTEGMIEAVKHLVRIDQI